MLNNRYQIRSTLGRGGFGQTYLVEDMHSPSRRLRVVKQLKPQAADPALFSLIRDRFEREAAILERLGETTDQILTLFQVSDEDLVHDNTNLEWYLKQKDSLGYKGGA